MTQLRGGKKTLELREIETIARNGRAAGAKVFGISGLGEPLADRLTPEVLSLTNDLGFISYVATNAALLNERKLRLLREKNVTLVISLDTADPVKFAEVTGTNVQMLERVITNLRMAQEVYSGTSQIKEVNGKKIQVFRLAVHSTMSEENIHEIERIRELIDEKTTLLSVSPIATVKSAESNALGISREAGKELTERHIVVTPHPKTGSPVCGLFLFGVDINFDGELLLDAHAIDSRGLIPNIRDFGFDVIGAFLALAKIKDDFVEHFMEGFCPVRSPRLGQWLELQKQAKTQADISDHIRNDRNLLKFAYLGPGAERFLRVTESPGYPTTRIEKDLLASNEEVVRDFIGGKKVVVLGAGDNTKLQHVLDEQRGAVLVDISRRMLDVSKEAVASPKLIEADFEKMDLAEFGEDCVFVMLGNTLGNFDDMKGLLESVSKVPKSKMVIGIELLPEFGPSAINRIVAEYKSETIFQFVFTPLEALDVKRSDGEITVSFNQEKRRVEHSFEFKDDEACEKLAKKLGLGANQVRKILLSISSKLSEGEFLSLVGESGLVVEKKFSQGTNSILLLANPGATPSLL